MMTRMGKPPYKIQTLSRVGRTSIPLTEFLGKMAEMTSDKQQLLKQAIEEGFKQELAKIAAQLGIQIPVTQMPSR